MGFEVVGENKVMFTDCDGDRHELDGFRVLTLEPQGNSTAAFSVEDALVFSRILAFYAEDGSLARARKAIDGDDAGGEGEKPDRVAESDVESLKSRVDSQSQSANSRLDILCRRTAGLGCFEAHARLLEDKFADIERRLGLHEGNLVSHSGRIVALESGLTTVEESLPGINDRLGRLGRFSAEYGSRIAELEGNTKPPEPVRAKTPQELAEEMTARFPVGTKVKFRMAPGSISFHGEVKTSFVPGPTGDPVAMVFHSGTEAGYYTPIVEPVE